MKITENLNCSVHKQSFIETTTAIHLHIVYGRFHATMVAMKETMAPKLKIFTIWSFTENAC